MCCATRDAGEKFIQHSGDDLAYFRDVWKDRCNGKTMIDCHPQSVM